MDNSNGKFVKTLLLGVLVLGWSQLASAVTVSVVPTSQTIGPAGSIDVDIIVSGLGDSSPVSLGGFDINVTYDASILTFQGVTFGDPILGDQLDLFGLGSLTDVTPGSSSVNVFELSLDDTTDLDSLQAGSFILATFNYSASALGTSTIGLNILDLSDALGDSLTPSSVIGGSVTVSAVPVPAAAYLFGSGLLGLVGIARRKKA